MSEGVGRREGGKEGGERGREEERRGREGGRQAGSGVAITIACSPQLHNRIGVGMGVGAFGVHVEGTIVCVSANEVCASAKRDLFMCEKRPIEKGGGHLWCAR